MDLKQILALALCVVPALTCPRCCMKESELAAAAERMLSRRLRRPPELPLPASSSSPARCPLEGLQGPQGPQGLQGQAGPSDLSLRSISPWRYVRVTNADYFPSSYAAAECLCSGCVLLNERTFVLGESHNYNSRQVTQTRVFLRRERCEGDGPGGDGPGGDGPEQPATYRLKPVYLQVPVACTCVRYQL